MSQAAELPRGRGRLEPWSALLLVPAAFAVLAGFGVYARERLARRHGTAGGCGSTIAARRPGRSRRPHPAPRSGRRPAALAGYELPMGLLGFPGVGWLFAGFPFPASVLLSCRPSPDVGRDSARLLALSGRAADARSAGRSSSSGSRLHAHLSARALYRAHVAADECCSAPPAPPQKRHRGPDTDPRSGPR